MSVSYTRSESEEEEVTWEDEKERGEDGGRLIEGGDYFE